MQVASHPVQAFRSLSFQNRLRSSEKSAERTYELKRAEPPTSHLQKTPSSQPLQAVHFQGLTSNLRGRHWVSGDSFKDLLSHQKHQRGHDGIGVLPLPIVQLFPNNPKQAFDFFNALSTELKQLTLLSQKEFTVNLTAKSTPAKPITLKLSFEEIGAYGQVYKVSVPTQNPHEPLKHYALKVYHLDADHLQAFCQSWPKQNINEDHPGPTVHGTLHEQASGLFFSDEPIADLARYHFGNPLQGWALSEWVDYQADSAKRQGPLLHEKVKGLTIGDDKNENHQGNVRVDLGGIYRPKPTSSETTTDELDKTPKIRVDVFDASPYSKPANAFEEFDRNTLSPGFELLIQHLKHKPPAKLNMKAFEDIYDYSQALKQLQDLPGESQKLKVFQQLVDLKRPEMTPILFRLVEYLPASERLNAMCKLLPQVAPETPVHLRESISYCLSELTPEERQQFNQKAFESIHQQFKSQRELKHQRELKQLMRYELTITDQQ